MKPIILTGMMGAGKSSVGKLLAQSLNLKFIDIDAEIEKQEKRTISDIFLQNGESYFRSLEEQIIKKNISSDSVIALGGGAFENKNTRDFLISNTITIYLKASPQIIYERISNNSLRPLLKDDMSVEKINEIYNKRMKNYEKAYIHINTDNKNMSDIQKEILESLKNEHYKRKY